MSCSENKKYHDLLDLLAGDFQQFQVPCITHLKYSREASQESSWANQKLSGRLTASRMAAHPVVWWLLGSHSPYRRNTGLTANRTWIIQDSSFLVSWRYEWNFRSNFEANFGAWWLGYQCVMKLASGDCHWTSLMTSQHWFRQWLGAVRHKPLPEPM